MPTRRAVLCGLGALAGCAGPVSRDDGGGDESATTTGDGTGVSLSIPSIPDGGTVPTEYTCEGANRSPAMEVDALPSGATTYAVVVDDPDAPRPEPFVHWLLWDVPATTRSLPAGVSQTPRLDDPDGAVQGTNSAGEVGYVGPCPPRGDGPHTYRFTVSAVDGSLDVDPGARRAAVDAALGERALAAATVTGTFARS